MRENDRRVKYTKAALRESLLLILESKPIGRVTVAEVARAAGLNRGTFYAHYADAYALLTEMEEELSRALEDAMKSDEAQGDIDFGLNNIVDVLEKTAACAASFWEKTAARSL